jgi:hypothetical protein
MMTRRFVPTRPGEARLFGVRRGSPRHLHADSAKPVMGRPNVTTVPAPGWLSTSIVPRCFVNNLLAGRQAESRSDTNSPSL